MPNYKLSPTVTNGMITVAKNLCQRRINVAQTGFPLTVEELEICAVGEELLAKFHDIASYGVATFDKTNMLVARFTIDLPSLSRPAMVRIGFAEQVYYAHPDQRYGYGARWTLPVERVPQNKRQPLAKWANNLVRETRMRAITEKTISWFLEGQEGNPFMGSKRQHWLGVDFITSAHIMANWPALAMLVDGKPGESNYYPQVSHTWRLKFNDAPPKLDRWETRHPEFIRQAKAIQLATQYLTSCEMLPTEAPKEAVTATLLEWTRLPGDPD